MIDHPTAERDRSEDPSPFSCPDQNRAKPAKAALLIAAMLVTSLALYGLNHRDTAGEPLHVQTAPAEDTSLHAGLR
jgi:hypothetical protein